LHCPYVKRQRPQIVGHVCRQAIDNGWLDGGGAALVDRPRAQLAPLGYPHLSHHETFGLSVKVYRQFYFSAPK
jgi:hypothetical protein